MRSSNTSKQVIVENYAKRICSHSMMTTPSYMKWIVTMWSFGVDTPGEHTGKEFEVTFGEGVSALYMIYTKGMKDGKNRDRSERQEYPNQNMLILLFENCFLMAI